MFGWLAKALAWFYEIWPSYGGSIILLTVAMMIVLLPLTLKGTRSMLEMQRLQPEMKRLQSKYKDDRAKLNEEMLALYREHKVNPVGGCLPMFLQLPVFWVLYRVLEGLTHRAPTGLDVGAAVANSHAVQAAGNFMPSYISHSSKLYKDLHQTSKMMSFHIDLSESVLSAIKGGLGHALPFIVLILVVIATTYMQQWQMQARVPKDQVNSQQQMMMKFMPLMFAVIYFAIPAGVVVYFLASNVFRIGQQYFITRTMYDDEVAAGDGAVAETVPRGLRALLPNMESSSLFGRGAQTKKGSTSSRAKGAAKTKSRPANARKAATSSKARSKQSAAGKGKQAAIGKGKQGPGGKRGSSPAKTEARPNATPAPAKTGATAAPKASGNGARKPSRAAPNRKAPPPPSRTGSRKKRK